MPAKSKSLRVLRDYVGRTVQPVVRVGKGRGEREAFWVELTIEEARFLSQQLSEACDAIEANQCKLGRNGAQRSTPDCIDGDPRGAADSTVVTSDRLDSRKETC